MSNNRIYRAGFMAAYTGEACPFRIWNIRKWLAWQIGNEKGRAYRWKKIYEWANGGRA